MDGKPCQCWMCAGPQLRSHNLSPDAKVTVSVDPARPMTPCPGCGTTEGARHAATCHWGSSRPVRSRYVAQPEEAVSLVETCTCHRAAHMPGRVCDCQTGLDGADAMAYSLGRLTKPKVDVPAAQAAVRALLKAMGEDPTREGLLDTPRRVAALWSEFIDYDPGKLATQFESAKTDQMVVVSGMRVWSMCEHHLLPFWCDVTVGYIASGSVLGLSKMGRIAHLHAHRLQLQERLVSGIATSMTEALGHANVAVIAQGEHLCMTARGIKTPALMTSSSIHGEFTKPEVRAEFMALALAPRPSR